MNFGTLTNLGIRFCDVDVKRLAEENLHKTLRGQLTSGFGDIAVSLNRHDPSTLRTHQYSRLRICRYCDLTQDVVKLVFVTRVLCPD